MEFDFSHDCYAFVILSSITNMSADKQTPDQPNRTSSLETDIQMLASLVASTTVTTTTTNGDRTDDPGETADGEENGELRMEDVDELIRRLEAANGIAEGVEDKLDGILQHLDGLLSSLEGTGETKENGAPVDPQPDR